MAAADIFKGILALGAGAARGYVQKKREDQSAEYKKMLKDMELEVRRLNLERMTERDAARGAYEQGILGVRQELADLTKQMQPHRIDEIGARIGNLESMVKDRSQDNAIAAMLANSLVNYRGERIRQGDERIDAQYPVDPATGQRVPASRSTGRGRVSQALQAFKSLTMQSRQGVSGAVLEAIQAAEDDDEFLDYFLPKLDESGIRLKKRLSKEDIEKLDAVARTALEVRRRANSAQAPPATAPTIGPDRLTE